MSQDCYDQDCDCTLYLDDAEPVVDWEAAFCKLEYQNELLTARIDQAREDNAKLTRQLQTAKAELADILSGRSHVTLESVFDKTTGITTIVRIEKRLEVKGMQLAYDQMQLVGYLR